MPTRPSYQRFFSHTPSPAEWTKAMTVCIAGVCQDETIVAVSDMMVSTGMFASDNMAMKFRDIHPHWKVMFAGKDMSRIGPLLTSAQVLMRQRGEKPALKDVEEVMRL